MEGTMHYEILDAQQFPKIELEKDKIINIKYPDTTELFSIQVDVNGDGIGEIRFFDFSTYQGNLKDGNPADFGIYYIYGVTVMGKFDEQYLNGEGVIRYSNGSVIRGNFRQNYLYGYGVGYEEQGHIYYAGYFRLNYPDGIGTLILNDFYNIWSNDFDNQLYFGYFYDGVPQGRGVSFTCSNKKLLKYNRYEGYFTSGYRDGPGALFLANGDVLIGLFARNAKVGMFLFADAQGAFEFRFYENDIVKALYKPAGYYISNVADLKCIVFDVFQIEQYDRFIQYFKYLEYMGRQNNSEESIKIMDFIFNYTKPLTVPLKLGLCGDLRVCQPLISEEIADIARDLTLEQSGDELVGYIEAIKSCILNNYDLLKFIFDFYKTKSKMHVLLDSPNEYKDDLQSNLYTYIEKCYHINDTAKQELIQQIAIEYEKYYQYYSEVAEETTYSPNLNISQSGELLQSYGSTNDILAGDESRELIHLGQYSTESVHEQNYNEPDEVINYHPSLLFAENCEQFYREIQHLPYGDSETHNELLHSFFKALDNQYYLVETSFVYLLQDLAAYANINSTFAVNQPFLQCILNKHHKKSDSYYIIQYFSIQNNYAAAENVFGFTEFILVLLNVYYIFETNNPIEFIYTQFNTFAKHKILKIAEALKNNEQYLNYFFTDEYSQYIFKRMTEAGQSICHDEFIETYSVNKSIMGLYSLKSKNNNSSKLNTQSQTVPRILIRDSSYSLLEYEQAIIRCYGLDNKLAYLFLTESETKHALLYNTLINDKIEYTIYDNLNCDQLLLLLDKYNISVLKFIEIAFDHLNELFQLPKFSEDPQSYINIFVPFLIKFTKFDVHTLLTNIYVYNKQDKYYQYAEENQFDKQAKRLPIFEEDFPIKEFYQILHQHSITPNQVIALISCIFLKQASQLFTVKEEKLAETNQDEDLSNKFGDSSELMNSIRSDNSLYSKYQDTARQKEQEQKQYQLETVFYMQNEVIDENSVKEIIDSFIKGIKALL